MTWEDPLVADVWRIRERLSAKFNFDVAAIFADIRSRQASAGDRLVHPPGHRQAEPIGKREPPMTRVLKSWSLGGGPVTAVVTPSLLSRAF